MNCMCISNSYKDQSLKTYLRKSIKHIPTYINSFPRYMYKSYICKEKRKAHTSLSIVIPAATLSFNICNFSKTPCQYMHNMYKLSVLKTYALETLYRIQNVKNIMDTKFFKDSE